MLGLSVGGESPPVTMGNTDPAVADLSVTANVQQGFALQASQSFTATRVFLRGPAVAGNQSFAYRLCIYAATSATVWSGALLGQTSDQASLNQNELREMALQASVSIVSGNFYALCIHADSPGGLCGRSTLSPFNDRFFADTYSDGPLGTAGASSLNSGSTRCMYISS